MTNVWSGGILDHHLYMLSLRIARLVIVVTLTVFAAGATDPYCPAYLPETRARWGAAESRVREFQRFSASHAKSGAQRRVTLAESPNLIDRYIFGKMQADGVTPAAASGDSEFLRRVYFDLTGRIPTVKQTQDFLASSDANKRQSLIEQLLGSDAYVDKWTLFYGNIFQVTSGYYNLISVQSRNRFNQYLREFVSADRSYANVAREIITASGDSYSTGPPNFAVRAYQQGDPIQDTWDTLTDQTTVAFLGLKTLCVSCHDGRGHLEQINLFLAPKKRTDFWQMSAFFARTNIDQAPVDTFYRQIRGHYCRSRFGRLLVLGRPEQSGPRPARSGGPYSPVFMPTGAAAASGRYRQELARMITAIASLRGAAVNYLWSAMFTTGIVDPPGQWDLARIDPANPPPEPVDAAAHTPRTHRGARRRVHQRATTA